MHRWRSAGAGLGMGLMIACMPTVEPTEGQAQPVAQASLDGQDSAPPVAGPWRVSIDGGAPAPVTAALMPVAGHVATMGWAADGQRFVYCRDLPELDCHGCRAVGRDGTVQTRESGPGCSEGVARPELDAWVQALAPAVSEHPSALADQVMLVVDGRQIEQTDAGQPRPMLKLGARSVQGGAPTWLVQVDPCEGCGLDQVCGSRAHVERLVPSPDGESIAALLHIAGGVQGDLLRLELLDASRLLAATR